MSNTSAVSAAKALGATRIAYGAGLLFAPRLFGGHWLGPAAAEAGAHPPLRSLGIRDAAVGYATIVTANRPQTCARVVALGIAGDLVDCLGTIAAHRADRRVRRVYAVAAMAAAIGSAVLAPALAQASAPR